MSVLRIKVNGRWVYQARVAYRNARKSTIKPTRDAAKIAEAELLAALRAQHAEQEAAGDRPVSVRQVFEAYVEDLEQRGKGKASVDRAVSTALVIEKFAPSLLERTVGNIADADVFSFRQARARAGTSASTINRDLRSLRAALRRACPGYRFPAGAFSQENDTRVRWLTPDERTLVLETMPSPFREIAKLAVLTLMRQGEIRTLTRNMIDLGQGVVALPRAKAGSRHVTLSEAAKKILQSQLEQHDSPWVFPSPHGRPWARAYISRQFRKSSRAAGLRDFRFHDLRHDGATTLLNAGFTTRVLMDIGGWKREAMVTRYAAVTDQTRRAAVEAISSGTPAPWTVPVSDRS